jgi:hypothetical protein
VQLCFWKLFHKSFVFHESSSEVFFDPILDLLVCFIHAINNFDQTCLTILISGKPLMTIIIEHHRGSLKACAWTIAAPTGRIMELDLT